MRENLVVLALTGVLCAGLCGMVSLRPEPEPPPAPPPPPPPSWEVSHEGEDVHAALRPYAVGGENLSPFNRLSEVWIGCWDGAPVAILNVYPPARIDTIVLTRNGLPWSAELESRGDLFIALRDPARFVAANKEEPRFQVQWRALSTVWPGPFWAAFDLSGWPEAAMREQCDGW